MFVPDSRFDSPLARTQVGARVRANPQNTITFFLDNHTDTSRAAKADALATRALRRQLTVNGLVRLVRGAVVTKNNVQRRENIIKLCRRIVTGDNDLMALLAFKLKEELVRPSQSAPASLAARVTTSPAARSPWRGAASRTRPAPSSVPGAGKA